MPMSEAFEKRLLPILPRIVEHFGTPFHIYDEAGIRQGGQKLIQTFQGIKDFREFFAVKANSNPAILKIMHELGFGFDCSSIPELILSRQAGASPQDIMFTSNNTSVDEFLVAAQNGGCILNLDDITLIEKAARKIGMPELICFRYNPGDRRCVIPNVIGDPVKAKYGIAYWQYVEAYQKAINYGAKQFGLQTMVVSNDRNYRSMVETVDMLLKVIREITKELGIQFEFINMGGGLGIPYKPEDQPIDLDQMAAEIKSLLGAFKKEQGYAPKLYMESGRWVAGPHGVLVLTCINQKHIYKEFRGMDGSCMSTMMRPAMYYPEGGYHHISVMDGDESGLETVNIVGSACENSDQFGHDRLLPKIKEGNLVLVHDTGAHCYGMTSQYNNRLRPKELLLTRKEEVALIRREETMKDLFATLRFEPDVFRP